jgi:replicative DNA helicase
VPASRIQTRQVAGELLDRVRERLAELSGLDYTIYPRVGNVDAIRAEVLRHQYDVVFVDHLHRLDYEDERELSRHIVALKNLALDANCAVIVAAQYKKQLGNPRPHLTHLKGSSSIEQEANLVLSLWRPDDQTGHKGCDAKFMVQKNRDGASDFDIDMRFDDRRLKFVERITAHSI